MANDPNDDTVETAEEIEAGLVEADVETIDASDGDTSEPGEPPILERREGSSANRHKRAVFGVPIQVVIAVGRASPSIGELMTMHRDTLLPLDAKIDDPVELMIGKRVIARGELQELEDEEGRLGVRLTEIVDLSEPF